ncbi:MAG: hypothetical protein A2064_09025 [Spirochaetes bacterium GWB1_66_5]|nr:MAG: hypothetical protein A2064_09025 [Spirochaetes bacterium GWB1_66_5]
MMNRLLRAIPPLCLAALASCGYFDPVNPPDPALIDKGLTWERPLGDGNGNAARRVQQTTDGLLLFGTKEGNTNESDMWLVKTDGAGTEQWSRAFGGAAEEIGRCLRPTPDGGYILVGSTRSNSAGGWDVYLVKTGADGNWQWGKTFGGTADDHGWSVECLVDGYAILGSTASFGDDDGDGYLIRVNGGGELLWQKTFGGANADEGYAVRNTSDGGFIIAGYTQASFASDDNAWLVKTDANGNLVWEKVFGAIAASTADIPGCLEQGRDVLLTPDAGYLLAGYTHSLGAGDFDAWLIKADDKGNKEWERTFGGEGWDQAEAAVLTADGGYALAGMSRFRGDWKQAWLAKTDAAGNLEWDKRFGGIGDEWAYALLQTPEQGYLLGGTTTSHGGDMAYLVYYKP